MKHYLVAVAALLACSSIAVAKNKSHTFGAPYPGAPVSGQPGQLPTTVKAPGALVIPDTFVYDGGLGSEPPVQLFSLVAPAFFISGLGPAEALGGFDGGSVPGVLVKEPGELTSVTMPAFTVLNHNYTNAPECHCGVALGTSYVITCQSQLDAGVGGPAGDGGPVTTVVMNTSDKDGGTFWFDCIGY